MKQIMSELTIQPVFDCKIIEAPKSKKKHQLPALKYDYAALEPTIDTRTMILNPMILHHNNHHGGYVKKINEASEQFPQFQDKSAARLLCNLA